jgi:hypothetical protein
MVREEKFIFRKGGNGRDGECKNGGWHREVVRLHKLERHAELAKHLARAAGFTTPSGASKMLRKLSMTL